MRATIIFSEKNQEVISNVRKVEYAQGAIGLTYGGKTRWLQRGVRVIVR